MTTTERVILPTGYWVKGVHQRLARLRPLNGEDQACLDMRDAEIGVASWDWATTLLARCVERLGAIEPVSTSLLGELTVGDREALLLHLRRMTLGDRMQATMRCPAAACGAPMDLDLRVTDLLLPPYHDVAPEHEFVEQMAAGPVRVRFRLPTVADQEAATETVLKSVRTYGGSDAQVVTESGINNAVKMLLRRCVRDIRQNGERIAELPTELIPSLTQRMSELDPQAELSLRAVCPACGGSFTSELDTARFLLDEIRGRTARLFREVHALAFHYHWSEQEILRLPLARRLLYLALLDEELRYRSGE